MGFDRIENKIALNGYYATVKSDSEFSRPSKPQKLIINLNGLVGNVVVEMLRPTGSQTLSRSGPEDYVQLDYNVFFFLIQFVNDIHRRGSRSDRYFF